MAWTPFAPSRNLKMVDIPTDLVRVMTSGNITLSHDIVERLGNPERIALLTNDDPSKLGIRAFTDKQMEQPYRLHRYSRRLGCQFAGYAAIWKLGYRANTITELPHAWDGDVLVIDVSSLPEREAVDGR